MSDKSGPGAIEAAGMRPVEEILRENGIEAHRVERPGSEEEVGNILSKACRDRMRVLPLGGGTSLGVALLPQKIDLVLDMRGMHAISELDPKNLNMTVEAGKTIDAINRELAGVQRGFMLPLDPPMSHWATIGGCYAANMSGPLRQLYGTLRDQALGVRAVNVEGRKVGFGGMTVKNVSGYDLTKFLIGSAGSLCVVTKISLRILPVPDASALCGLIFPRDSDLEGFLKELRRSVLIPSAVVARWKAGDDSRRVDVGFEGYPKAVDRQVRDVQEMAAHHGGSGEAIMGREGMREELRRAMDVGDGPGDRSLRLKMSVPISRGLEAAEGIEALASQGRLEAQVALLAGNGVLFLCARDESMEVLKEFSKGVRGIAVRLGGHVTPVRGPREVLEAWGARMDPVLERNVVRPIKEAWDPVGVLLPVTP
mgnify:CR=1 FL=1